MIGEQSMKGVRKLTITRQLNSNLASSLIFGPPLVGLEWSVCVQNGPDHSCNQWAYFSLLGRVASPCIASLILLAHGLAIVPSKNVRSSGSTSQSCCP